MKKAPKGNSAFDPETALWVTFPSVADALIADLSFSHDIPLSTIDLVLSALSHPQFDLSQLTLKSSVDIFLREAEYRSAMIDRRAGFPSITDGTTQSPDAAGQKIVSQRPAGIPATAFQLITEYMAELPSWENFEKATCAWRRYSAGNGYRAELPNMCLVHRTWAFEVQRLLFKRAFVGEHAADYRKSISLLRNPFYGQSIRELAFRFVCSSFNNKIRENDRDRWLSESADVEEEQNSELVAHLLRRASNVQRLAIVFERAYVEIPYGMGVGSSYDDYSFLPSPVVQAIGTLVGLSRLSINYQDALGDDLCANLFHMLPRLQALEYLHLESCTVKGAVIDAELPPSSPPPSLKTVILVAKDCNNSFSHTPYFSWLLNPYGRYALQNLVFKHNMSASKDEDTQCLRVVSTIEPCCAHLDYLCAGFVVQRSYYMRREEDVRAARIMSQFGRILSQNNSLKVLHFDESVFSDDIRVPTTVEEVGFFIEMVTEPSCQYRDESMHRVLRARPLPCLRTVVFYSGNNDSKKLAAFQQSFNEGFPSTSRCCEELGIHIAFRLVKSRKFDTFELLLDHYGF